MKILLTDLDNVLCSENGLYDDAMGFLRAAHEKFFIIVLTNHPLKNTQERIAKYALSGYIDYAISAADYEMPKPDARIINVLLALLNNEGKKFDKGDIMLVGDRPSIDMRLGNKAGIRTTRIRRGRYADEEAEYPEEVANIEVKDLAELAASFGIQIKREEPKAEEIAPQHDLSQEFDEGEITLPFRRTLPAKRKPAKKRKTRAKAKRRKAARPEKKRGFFDFG